MQPLGFTQPISSDSQIPPSWGISTVAFFDSYFLFSNKCYRVCLLTTCTVNGVQEYHVEEHSVKQNIPLNILKAISYLTLIIPLIMGIGKLIARSQFKFFIDEAITPDMVHSFEINGSCSQTMPCSHQCKITLLNGKISENNLDGDDIYTLIGSISRDKISAIRKNRGVNYQHFEEYKDALQKPPKDILTDYFS